MQFNFGVTYSHRKTRKEGKYAVAACSIDDLDLWWSSCNLQGFFAFLGFCNLYRLLNEPHDSLTSLSSENECGCLRELMGVFCNIYWVPGGFKLGQLHSFEPISVVMLPSFKGIEISFLLNMIFYIMCIRLRFKINSFIACL